MMNTRLSLRYRRKIINLKFNKDITTMKLFHKLAAVTATTVLAFGVISAPARAAGFRSCSTGSYDISDNVTGASNCDISNDFNQDFVSPNKPLTVNEAGFFGNTDWMFGGKIGSNSGYDGTSGGQSGSWDISNVIQNTWDDVMLVFKSGQGTQLVGYQLNDGVSSGTWDSPFEKAAFNFNGKNTKDVSHISVYYREEETPKRSIPEPTSMLGLLGFGVFGTVSTLKRKQKQEA